MCLIRYKKITKILFSLLIVIAVMLGARYLHDTNQQSASNPVTTLEITDERCFSHLVYCDNESGAIVKTFYSNANDIWYMFMPTYFSEGRFTLSSINPNFATYEMVPADNYSGDFDFSLDSNGANYIVTFLSEANEIIDQGVLCVMNSQNLPAIYLYTESGNMNYLDEDKERYETTSTMIFDASGKNLYSNSNDILTGHGNRSWNGDKKPYTLKLQEDIPLFGMATSNDWVLISNVSDSSYIQNAITYEMAEAADMPYTPHFQYIDLYFNSIYQGNYLVVEKNQVNQEHIDIQNLNSLNYALNPDLRSGTAKTFASEKMKGYELEKNPPDISGGYLIEHDYAEKYSEETTGFVTNILSDKYTIKSPDSASREEIAYISNFVNNFETSLLSGGNDWMDYIDIQSFADKYIVDEFTMNAGGGITSAFYYKPQDSISKKMFAGPVWDYDTAYANSSTFLYYLTIHNGKCTQVYYHLYQQPEFQNAVKEEWTRFFSNYISNTISGRIDYYAELIYRSQLMDSIRWNRNLDDISDRRDHLKTIISERTDFLDQIWIYNEEIIDVHAIDAQNQAQWNYGMLKGAPMKTIAHGYTTWTNVTNGSRVSKGTPIYSTTTLIGSN